MSEAKNKDGIETERKYLIKYPDCDKLLMLPGARKAEILQIYLKNLDGQRRVRIWTENGKSEYIQTVKNKITEISRTEKEDVITKKEYDRLLSERDMAYHPLKKTRYVIPYKYDGGELTAEIDVYPYFDDVAILEIETPDESEYPLPDFVDIIREVTQERTYKNTVLAMEYAKE